MTKNEFNNKIKEMLVDCQEYLLKECDRLFESGGVEPDNFENDYLLPKIILTVALKSLSFQYYPLHEDGKAQAKNLEHF